MFVSPQTDRLPHEPLRVRAAAPAFALRLLWAALVNAALWSLTLWLWPLFAIGALSWGWPPHKARPREFARYLRMIWTARPPEPGLPPLSRVFLTLLWIRKLGAIPLAGLAWHLDELIYGRALDAAPLREPLILLSAARSGSTQISRYLESDPRLAAPSVAQIFFPYLWLWRLAAPTLGRVVQRRWLDALLERYAPEEVIQRHEFDVYGTDTFEVVFYLQRLNGLAPCLGPAAYVSEFGFARAGAADPQMWAEDFAGFVDRLGRKTLRFAGPGPDGAPRRLYVKGHFQAADDALAERLPDARFVTVVRDPSKRLASAINHLHGNPFCEPLGAVPWAWLAEGVSEDAANYCLREQEWFSRPDGPARTVVRFTDYVRDLEGVMTDLYRDCFGDEALPGYVPTEHPPRERRDYRVNRGLAELGIDAEAWAAPLAGYRAWCEGEG